MNRKLRQRRKIKRRMKEYEQTTKRENEMRRGTDIYTHRKKKLDRVNVLSRCRAGESMALPESVAVCRVIVKDWIRCLHII